MTPTEHTSYAKELLSSLVDDHPGIESLVFDFDRTQNRNAAKAMEAIVCHRLAKNSGQQPRRKRNTTYEWKEGIFNCRNIADRDYLWTNIRRNVADGLHNSGRTKPVAYLLAFSNPSAITLSVWAIPEPILYDSLSSIPLKQD